jgi:pyochelin synthetase
LAHFPGLADVDALRKRVLRAASGGADAPGFERETLYRLFKHSVDASQIATGAPYVGSLRLFVPREGNPLVPAYRSALERYWGSAVVGACDVQDIPGGHFGCLGADLAEYLRREMSA